MTTIFHRPVVGQKGKVAGVICLSWILIAGGVVALAYVAWSAAERAHFQRKELQKVESVSQVQPTSDPPIHAAPQPGSVLGRLHIRRLGLESIVVEGDSPGILRHAVGHIPKTALPGQLGNIGLAAHRDSLFRSLRLIRPHDVVTFRTPDHEFQYEVESTNIVPPSATSVLWPSAGNQLTLITCYPFNYIGPAPDRFVVVAKQIAQGPQK